MPDQVCREIPNGTDLTVWDFPKIARNFRGGPPIFRHPSLAPRFSPNEALLLLRLPAEPARQVVKALLVKSSLALGLDPDLGNDRDHDGFARATFAR
jgi:hypothetical protein